MLSTEFNAEMKSFGRVYIIITIDAVQLEIN